ncbi:aromatic ring-opening dioxygenase LigB subunit [Gilbertella persicaria]|uniref:aromatic ring-opening dioxygenase LigB subunit n=1 Tax=Gilbertella persicaria TaxID=101096 RepID=UPI0022201772|nr:aromatic ring-opening dioxygenase LigB subunit [Gilbertella persicaria]KAI8087015.1 aromatic ring-opening dioxygenase LigB subunit [Gilbertella persicaria]
MSAHWQAEGENTIYVDASKSPKLIYDFYNFPQRFYEQTWDQQGSPALADKVIHLLKEAGIHAEQKEYGNDHGVWVPLKRAMSSNKYIPIIEISTFYHEDLSLHVKVGEALSSLREEDVLIIGSGSAVHNLQGWRDYGDKLSPDYVVDFDKRMESIATHSKGKERIEAAVKLDQHPHYRDCHPTAEHLVPFHTALGAAGDDQGTKLLEHYTARLSWGSYIFGSFKHINQRE